MSARAKLNLLRSSFQLTKMPRVKKEPAEITIDKIQYRPLHPLHFEELNGIWEADRRIPSVASRRAWAEVRNLNPINVNSWWYRRRPRAKKLKIKIPRDEYELDVGIPPDIPEIEEVKAEVSTEISSSEISEIGTELSSPSLPTSDARTSISVTCPSDHSFLVKNPLFEELSAEMDAYMRSSSPLSDFYPFVPSPTSTHSITSRHSSLPPSSPPLIATSTLLFPEDMVDEDDTIDSPSHFRESIQAEETCSSATYVPQTFSNQLARNKTPETTKRHALPLYPTWCLSGYRIAYDGSFLGFCSCSVDDDLQNS